MGSPRDHLHIEKAGRVRVVPTTHGSSYPARAAEQGFIFQQILLLLLLLSSSSSSFCCQHCNISETLCPIMLILGQKNKSANAHF